MTKASWCGPGHSLYSTMITNILFALGHRDYEKLRSDLKNPDFVKCPFDNCSYLIMDLSAQDYTFSNVSLWLCSVMRLNFIDFSSHSEKELFALFHLLLAEMMATHQKTVEWFSKLFYVVIGVMISGYKGTSHFDTFSVKIAMLIIIVELLKFEVKNWLPVLRMLFAIFYGDDTIVVIPPEWIPYFCTSWVAETDPVPDKFIDMAKKLNLVIKPAETRILIPKSNHHDRFYSGVQDDRLVLDGVKFLQRRFVKIDQFGGFLHPDAERWHKVIPWRQTSDYWIRSANHNFDWDHPTKLVSMAFFQKIVGLMYDAGMNRTAHNYLKGILHRIECSHPGTKDWAVHHMDLAEIKLRVPEASNSHVAALMSEDSFDFIVNLHRTKLASITLRFNSHVYFKI